LQRSAMTKQRQDIVDDHSYAITENDEVIKPVRLPLQMNDEFEDGGYIIEDTVSPDDSVTFRGTVTKPRHKGTICQREMAELRRLIQSDDRFGRTLERTCQAVCECISECNPSPILALLASLVWNSLCIVWELEPKNPLPKAHLRSRIEGLKGEHQHVVESFDNARRDYLKEIVGLRDQIRRLDASLLVHISSAVYEEEPVMFYEPLQYLSEKERVHIAEIVEEKVKLVLSKMDPTFVESLKKEKKTEPDDDAEARAGYSFVLELYEKSKRRVAELEDQLRRAQAPSTGVRKSISALMAIANQEWNDVSSLLQEEDDSSDEASNDNPKVLSYQTSATQLPAIAETRLSSIADPSRASLNADSSRASLTADSSRSSIAEGRRLSTADRSNLSALSQRAGATDTMDDLQHSIEFMIGLLHAERQARTTLQTQFDQFRRSAIVDTPVEEPASKQVDASELEKQEAKLREAELQEAKMRQNLVEKERARARAEERAKSLELELARLQTQLSEQESQEKRNTDLRLEMELRLAKSERLRRQAEQDLEKALQTIEELREEIRRLKVIRSEPRQTEEQRACNPVWSESLHWRTPTGKVFERLFQDSVDRADRRRTLITSLQQARNEQALEIFQGHLRQMSSYDLPIDENGFTESELCPEVLQQQICSWVMDRSKKSFVDHTTVTNDREIAEALRDDISANVDADLARGKGSPTKVTVQRTRSNSPRPTLEQGPSVPSERAARARSRSDKRNSFESAEANMMLEGIPVELSGEAEERGEFDIIAENGTQRADQKGDKVKFKDFAAALGLPCPTDFPSAAEAPRQSRRRPAATSRPNSAQILRRAKQTITARPRSAVLQGFSRMQRPHSEVALAREAQRILSQEPATKPAAKHLETLSNALGRCSSVPGLRRSR